MAPPEHTSDKQTCYSFIDPGRMKGWVGLIGWPVADGLPTKSSPVGCRLSAGLQPDRIWTLDPDGFHNLISSFLFKDTSPVKFSRRHRSVVLAWSC